MGKVLICLWQWTWGFPQNFLGFLLSLKLRKCPRSRYRECRVIHWDDRGSMSLGLYLFMGSGASEAVYVHEFGHTIQSAILGPLYLPVIGIPSWLWCNLKAFRKLRKDKGISYYRFYPESTANYLGSRITGQPCDPE